MTEDGTIKRLNYSLELSEPRYMLPATTIRNYAIFAGGACGGNGKVIDVFRTSKTQLVSFNGLTPNLHITPEIILDEDDEQLAEP